MCTWSRYTNHCDAGPRMAGRELSWDACNESRYPYCKSSICLNYVVDGTITLSDSTITCTIVSVCLSSDSKCAAQRRCSVRHGAHRARSATQNMDLCGRPRRGPENHRNPGKSEIRNWKWRVAFSRPSHHSSSSVYVAARQLPMSDTPSGARKARVNRKYAAGMTPTPGFHLLVMFISGQFQ